MGCAIKLLVAGVVAICVGLWWLVDGLCDGLLAQAVGGLLWKGPLLTLVGAAALVVGARLFSEERQTARQSPAASSGGGLLELVAALLDLLRLWR
jgi:hypothetical protein